MHNFRLIAIFFSDVIVIKMVEAFLPLLRKDCYPIEKYEFESSAIEIISIEIVIKKRKWIVHTVYRPPSFDLALFFNELSNILHRSFGKYENLLILGDLNIDLSDKTKIPKSEKELLQELCDAYDLDNLISESTCITKTSESMIDLILKNCSRSFMHPKTIEMGLSDFHKMTITTMNAPILIRNQSNNLQRLH